VAHFSRAECSQKHAVQRPLISGGPEALPEKTRASFAVAVMYRERHPTMGDQKSSGLDQPGALGDDAGRHKVKRKEYEKELRKLQTELCSLQDWVKATGERIIVIFEGR